MPPIRAGRRARARYGNHHLDVGIFFANTLAKLLHRSRCIALPMYYWPSAEWATSSRFCWPYEKAGVHFWLLTKYQVGSKVSARNL
ncbi:MAG: hypothetical protein WBV26_01495 [Candidatus Sulfotelmatobacter sp.]